jgi:hypothetical protein
MPWLRRWLQRDDRHLFKSATPVPEIDPIDELARIVGAAQERDAEDERRFDLPIRPDTKIFDTNTVFVGVVSEADFDRARRYLWELRIHQRYDDWLDSRHGRFMGLSLGGREANFVTVKLSDFLRWCKLRRISPSEGALDAFAGHSGLRSS